MPPFVRSGLRSSSRAAVSHRLPRSAATSLEEKPSALCLSPASASAHHKHCLFLLLSSIFGRIVAHFSFLFQKKALPGWKVVIVLKQVKSRPGGSWLPGGRRCGSARPAPVWATSTWQGCPGSTSPWSATSCCARTRPARCRGGWRGLRRRGWSGCLSSRLLSSPGTLLRPVAARGAAVPLEPRQARRLWRLLPRPSYLAANTAPQFYFKPWAGRTSLSEGCD